MLSKWSFNEAKELRKISTYISKCLAKENIISLKIKITFNKNLSTVDIIRFEIEEKDDDKAYIKITDFITGLLSLMDAGWLDENISSVDYVLINRNYSFVNFNIKERYFTREKSIKLKHLQKSHVIPFLKSI